MFSVDDRNGSYDVLLMRSAVAAPPTVVMAAAAASATKASRTFASRQMARLNDNRMFGQDDDDDDDDDEAEEQEEEEVLLDPMGFDRSDEDYWKMGAYSLEKPYEDDMAAYATSCMTTDPISRSHCEARLDGRVYETTGFGGGYGNANELLHSRYIVDASTYHDHDMMREYSLPAYSNYAKKESEVSSINDSGDLVKCIDPRIVMPGPFSYQADFEPSDECERPSPDEIQSVTADYGASASAVVSTTTAMTSGTFTSGESDLDDGNAGRSFKRKRVRSHSLSEKEIVARHEAQLRKNRDFAKLSRDRKKLYVQALQFKLATLASEHAELVDKRDRLINVTRHMQDTLARIRQRAAK